MPETYGKTKTQLLAAACFASLWGVGLFSVLEVDVLTTKALILAGLVPLSLALGTLFYGCNQRRICLVSVNERTSLRKL